MRFPASLMFMKELITESGKTFRQRLRNTARGRHGSEDMTRDQAREALDFLISRESEDVQIAAFLTAMRFKSTTLDEYLGFFDAIYEHSLTIRPEVENLVNIGGPYDGRKRFLQLTPGAALVAAAAGVPVILHSSTGLPPKQGVTSAHVLEHLGVPAMLSPEYVQKDIELYNFGFLHASQYSFAIERFRHIREILFYRTFLHSCEVMINPAGAERHIIGAAHDKFLERFADVLISQGAKHVLSVQGQDGGDELPLSPVAVMEYKDGKKSNHTWNPEDFGLKTRPTIGCKKADETAMLIKEAIHGEGPDPELVESIRDSLIYNGGIRIYLGGKVDSVQEGIAMAKKVMEEGAVAHLLITLASPR